MRKTILNLAFAALACGLMAQASATKIPYSLQAAENDKEFQAALEKLSPEDRKLVIQYMLRIDLATVIPTIEAPKSGVDISEAIASQKAVNEKKEKAGRSADEVRDQLQKAVEFSNVAVMKNTDPDYLDDSVFVTASVTNKTEKIISGIKIVVTATDVFGDNLDQFGPKSEKDLAPGETVRVSGHYRSSNFLRANPKKVTASAEAIQIVFKDGSQMKGPKYQ